MREGRGGAAVQSSARGDPPRSLAPPSFSRPTSGRGGRGSGHFTSSADGMDSRLDSFIDRHAAHFLRRRSPGETEGPYRVERLLPAFAINPPVVPRRTRRRHRRFGAAATACAPGGGGGRFSIRPPPVALAAPSPCPRRDDRAGGRQRQSRSTSSRTPRRPDAIPGDAGEADCPDMNAVSPGCLGASLPRLIATCVAIVRVARIYVRQHRDRLVSIRWSKVPALHTCGRSLRETPTERAITYSESCRVSVESDDGVAWSASRRCRRDQADDRSSSALAAGDYPSSRFYHHLVRRTNRTHRHE